jgi:hypothetical protein
VPTDLIAIAKKSMTPEEESLLKTLTKPDTAVEVLLPDTMDKKEWSFHTSTVCRAYVRAEVAQAKLLPVIGRLLDFAKQHKAEIWEKFESWEAFMEAEVYDKFGIGRSTAYEALQMAHRLPHMSVGELQAIPRRNIKIALQAIPKGDEKKGPSKTLLAKAAELSEADLRDFCESKGYLEPNTTQGGYIKIPASKKVIKMWEKFIADPQIQAVCGSPIVGDILERMLEECASEWKATAEDAAKAGKPEKEDAVA